MTVGSGGYYTNNLTIGVPSDLPTGGLIPVDTQAAGGSAPQTLAFEARAISAGPFEVLAAAGATQGDAAAITSQNVYVTVTASTQGVILPAWVQGRQVRVFASTTVGVLVYPPTGGIIGAGAANAAEAVALNKATVFACGATSGTWRALRGA